MAHSAAPIQFVFGSCVAQPAARQLLVGGEPAKLGGRAFDLLLALIERRERVVSKNELLDLVWPGLVVEENNLQVHVSALRKLLGPAAIATIPGRGYRFTAALDGVSTSAAAPADRQAAPVPANLAPATSTPAPALEPAASAPGNLPRHLSPLIGRDDELGLMLAQIETHRLVTVVGSAGMGKTVLAQAAAHALRKRWRDGAWFVELAPVTDPAQLVQAVAQALRITLPAAGPPQDQLVSVLGSQTLLLVLDNCEHLVDAAGSLAQAIVERATGVRLLATSQELLNIPDEKLFKLSPLAVPAAGGGEADIEQFGAVRLFTERAQAVDPRFKLSAANAEAVVDICRRLDGLPLAIELAAARVRMLGVQGLRDKLGERFRVLTGGARTSMRRHQTLHAAIDWSHALLAVNEQTVLRRLGVFVGGFSLELAQQLAHDEQLDEWAVLDALSGLVDKSLVVADAGELPRYRLLETTRAYALEKLGDADETNAWLERHARTVCELFERTEAARYGERGMLSMAAFMQRLVPELDNVRAALDWATGEVAELAIAVALAGASAEVFRQLGLAHEALRRMLALQAGVDDSVAPQRAALFWRELCWLGNVGRLPQALLLDAADRAPPIYRANGERRRLHQALIGRAWALNLAGDPNGAAAMLPEILSLEDPAWPAWMRCKRLNLQGFVYHIQQRFDDALSAHRELQAQLSREPGEELDLLRCQGNLCLTLVMLQRNEEAIELACSVLARKRSEHSGGMVFVLRNLMFAQVFLGRIDDAWQTMREAMPGWRRDGFVFVASGLLATLLAERGRWADAARLGAAAKAYQRRSNIEHHPSLRLASARLQKLLKAAPCKPEDIERWQREGQALDEAAIAEICLRDEAKDGAAPSSGA